ncbi:MAG: hypothetical protein AAF399_08070, partial [Bacteroidota bacterium]
LSRPNVVKAAAAIAGAGISLHACGPPLPRRARICEKVHGHVAVVHELACGKHGRHRSFIASDLKGVKSSPLKLGF